MNNVFDRCQPSYWFKHRLRDKPALLGFSATQAMVIPPISESLKRSRKVPFGLDSSMSWACCLFRKPKIALEKPYTHVQPCCLTLMTVLMKPSRNVTHHSNEPSGVSSSARWLHQTTARRWSSYLVNSPTQHTVDQINEWYLAGLFWCWHLPAVSLA